MSTALMELSQITRSFGGLKAVNDINLTLNSGEQYALCGPSGSGKSSLLFLLAGLDRPTEGKILFEGRDLAQKDDEALAQYRNHEVGLVFQFHFLLPSMKASDNILLPTRIGNGDLDVAQETMNSLANTLKVTQCLDKYPYQLSGGEQQRINLIRSLIRKPKLLLCDEPTGNLDSENTSIVVDLLKGLAFQNKSTLVVVTHDQSVAKELPKQLFMQDGELCASP